MAKNVGLKKYISFIFKISISALLLIFLFSRIDFQKTIFYIRSVRFPHFMYAIVIFLVIVFLAIIRWNILLKILKNDLSFGRIFVSQCGGLFFNTCLPSSIGGDIARTVDLSVHTKDASSIMATVFLDRLFGFTGLVLVSLFGFLYGYYHGFIEDLRLLTFILIMVFSVLSAFLVLFSKRAFRFFNKIMPFKFLRDFLEKFHTTCFVFRFQKKVLIQTLALSLLIQGGFSFVVYFIGMSLGISANIVYYLVFIPIVNTVSILPISIGGLGVRDNAAVILFSTIGVAADRVAAMTLLNFAFLFFVGLIGGSIYGFAFYSRRIQRNTQDALSGS